MTQSRDKMIAKISHFLIPVSMLNAKLEKYNFKKLQIMLRVTTGRLRNGYLTYVFV